MSTTYADSVDVLIGLTGKRVSVTSRAEILAVAEALDRLADTDGYLPLDLSLDKVAATVDREMYDSQCERAVAALREVGAVEGYQPSRIVRPGAISPPVTAVQTVPVPAPSPVAGKPRKPPATGVETRDPVDQNDHTLALVNSGLLGKQGQHVAMVASVELAISASRDGVSFARAERGLTHSYLAGKTGWSDRAVRTAMTEATNLGFFERTDHAQGGRNGKGRSTYRPRVPAYLKAPNR